MVRNEHALPTIGYTLIVLSLVALVAGADQLHGRCVDVVDGDTLIIEVDGVRRTVHLFGIDAPELEQPFGDEAAAVLAPLVGSDLDIQVSSMTADEIVGTVVADDGDVAQMLVDDGCAWIVEDGPTNERYVVALFSARLKGRCVWAEGDPIHPAKWRRDNYKEPTPQPVGLSDVAAGVDLEKDEDGKAVIDSTDIPSMYARYAEGKLFVDRMIEIAQVAEWVQKADQIWQIYCGESGSADGDGSVWSEEVGAWVDSSIAPKGCKELDRQITAARAWVHKAKKVATQDAGRGGIKQSDINAVVDGLDLEEQ